MVFCARQLQEKKNKEQHRLLYMVFYDLEKAFDSVPREILWKVWKRIGCPLQFVNLVRELHDGMSCRVICEGKLTDPFQVTCGVKQGCVLAPTLFSLYLGVMMKRKFHAKHLEWTFISDMTVGSSTCHDSEHARASQVRRTLKCSMQTIW